MGTAIGIAKAIGFSAEGAGAVDPYAGAFVFTIETTSNPEVFTIPCQNVGAFNAVVDWGDGGPSSTITAYNDADLAHSYATAGSYQVSISGTFPNVYFNNGAEKDKIKSIENIGTVGWLSFLGAFYGCSQITAIASVSADTSSVTTFSYAFRDCSSITTFDTSKISTAGASSTSSMFYGLSSVITLNVNHFDMSSVTNAQQMFRNCTSMTTCNVSSWNTSSIANMVSVFQFCTLLTSFDPSTWDITDLTAATNFCTGTSMTTSVYDNLLVNWEAQSIPNVDAGFGSSKYSAGAPATARAALVSNGWTITDGGPA